MIHYVFIEMFVNCVTVEINLSGGDAKRVLRKEANIIPEPRNYNYMKKTNVINKMIYLSRIFFPIYLTLTRVKKFLER